MAEPGSGARLPLLLRAGDRFGGRRIEPELSIELRVALKKYGLLVGRHFTVAQGRPLVELTDKSLVAERTGNFGRVDGDADLSRDARHNCGAVEADLIETEDFEFS